MYREIYIHVYLILFSPRTSFSLILEELSVHTDTPILIQHYKVFSAFICWIILCPYFQWEAWFLTTLIHLLQYTQNSFRNPTLILLYKTNLFKKVEDLYAAYFIPNLRICRSSTVFKTNLDLLFSMRLCYSFDSWVHLFLFGFSFRFLPQSCWFNFIFENVDHWKDFRSQNSTKMYLQHSVTSSPIFSNMFPPLGKRLLVQWLTLSDKNLFFSI